MVARSATPPIEPTMAGTRGTTFDGAVEGVGEALEVGKMVAPGPKAVVDVREGVNRLSEAENEDENVPAETDVADSELGTIELAVALTVEEKGKLDEVNVVDIGTRVVELEDWAAARMEEVLKKEVEAVRDGAVAVNVRFDGIIDSFNGDAVETFVFGIEVIDVIVVRVVALLEDVIVDGIVVVTLDVVRRVDAVVVRFCKATDCTRAVGSTVVLTPLVEVVIVEVFGKRIEDGIVGVDSNEEIILVRFSLTCGVGSEGTLLDNNDSSEARIDDRMLVTLGIDKDAVRFTDITGGGKMPALTEVGKDSDIFGRL